MTGRARPSGKPHRRTLAQWIADSRVVVRARDDRARRVVLLDPTRVRASSALADPAAASRLAWARSELKAGTFGLRLLLCWMLPACVVLAVLSDTEAPAAVWWTVLPVLAVLLWLLNRSLARRGSPRRTRRVASLLADHGLCPTCAYRLTDLRPEQDGCTVCPECGGAWRRSAVATFAPAIPGSPGLSRSGWRRHLPGGLIRDDRRESHAVVRLPPDDLLGMAWTEDQQQRLRRALNEARAATVKGRRTFAAIQFVLGCTYLGFAGWAGMMAAKLATEEQALVAGGLELLLLAFPIGFMLFLMGKAAFALASGRRMLGPHGWLAFPKGYACLARHGFCAACLNDLTELNADTDGCTVCPECGAAWRLPDAGAQAAQSP